MIMAHDPHYDIPIGTKCEWKGCILTLTEDGWRAEVKHSMHRRCKGWDYCKPWTYMVTMSTQHHEEMPRPLVEDAYEMKQRGDMAHAYDMKQCDDMARPYDMKQRDDMARPYVMPEWLQREYARKGHPHLFGALSPVLGDDGEPYIALNAFGKAVERCIDDIPRFYPQFRVIERVVMPNHVHIVLRVVERLPEKKPLGFYLNKWKVGVNQAYKEICLGVRKETKMHIRQSSRPMAETARLRANRIKGGGHGHKDPDTGLVFETNFHDRILFRPEQLGTVVAYVRENPRRLWELVHNREYFVKTLNWRLTLPVLPEGGTKNAYRWWHYYPGGREALLREGVKGLIAPLEFDGESMTITFNAIGNRELLQVPERMQIQCSRSMSEEAIDELVDDVLEACAHGVVIISPCISNGEKRVARAVMDAGYPLIVIFPNGIPPQSDEYKPYGAYFYACAKGQLLILSPWDFKKGTTTLARWQCLMLNDVSAQMSV